MQKEPDRNQRRVLGKGLSALLPTRQATADQPLSVNLEGEAPGNYGRLQSIPLTQIQPNQGQPRSFFDPVRMDELAHSMRVNGLLQPITVYRIGPERYRIIAGERRWRAASLAGFSEIPALVRTVEQHQILELALIENIQRENLNPIEVAKAFQALVDHHGLQHDQIAERTGKDRSTISNYIRLLKLSNHVQQALIDGKVTGGHARALLNLPSKVDQETVCQRIIADQLSVRETERAVKAFNSPAKQQPSPPAAAPLSLDPNVKAALEEIAMSLGTKVNLHATTPTSGRLEIEYYSGEDLDRIYSVITKQ